MEKVLFVATVDKHIRHFHLPFLKWFKDQGYEVHVASSGQELLPYTDRKYDIPMERSPLRLKNLSSYFQLRKIIYQNGYKLIHCHTPVGAALARLASRHMHGKGTRVLYTAHGFHFYRGSNLKNWILFYPVEKWLSRYTDCLITINQEDYEVARKSFKTRNIEHVNGVGVDPSKYYPVDQTSKLRLRNEYGFRDRDFILVYVAELSHRKHQDLLIKAVSLLKSSIPDIKLLLVGDGPLKKKYTELIHELHVAECVELMGYREDVDRLLKLSDIAVSSSRQEGLPVNVIESLGTGLPLIVSNSRGNRDLVIDEYNGFLAMDLLDFCGKVRILRKNGELTSRMGRKSLELFGDYTVEKILDEMSRIYMRELQ